MSLYFMRHGDTFSKKENKNMSVIEASRLISLSDLGKEQVRKVVLPLNLDCIILSDSLRTKQTVEILLEENNLSIPAIVDERLHPWDSGASNWESYWNSYMEFIGGKPNSNVQYESKESMINRLQSVISDYSEKEHSDCRTLNFACYLFEERFYSFCPDNKSKIKKKS